MFRSSRYLTALALLAAGCSTTKPKSAIKGIGVHKPNRMVHVQRPADATETGKAESEESIESSLPEKTAKVLNHEFVQLYIYETIDSQDVKKTLLIPPLGLDSVELRETFMHQLLNNAQRYFSNPVDRIPLHSSFAQYVDEDNLIASDGVLNIPELAAIGNFKNASHILCPIVDQLKPYPPQQINLRFALLNVAEQKIVAELYGFFDAKDQATHKAFVNSSKLYDKDHGQPGDLRTKIQSPSKFRRFVAYTSCKMLTEYLPL